MIFECHYQVALMCDALESNTMEYFCCSANGVEACLANEEEVSIWGGGGGGSKIFITAKNSVCNMAEINCRYTEC